LRIEIKESYKNRKQSQESLQDPVGLQDIGMRFDFLDADDDFFNLAAEANKPKNRS